MVYVILSFVSQLVSTNPFVLPIMRYLLFLLVVFMAVAGKAQESTELLPTSKVFSVDFNGQLTAWSAVQLTQPVLWLNGGRFVPTLTGRYRTGNNRGWDAEASLNINGSAILSRDSVPGWEGQLKPYRVWLRYYTPRFELRAGLQKLNFGAAKMLRPLMWFDGMDVRDPLQLTDGVYGLLGRYYADGNMTFWGWALTGNTRPKGYELVGTAGWKPELGGRIQLPLGPGEFGLSYHHRKVNPATADLTINELFENRIGFDGKWDVGVGLWIEGSLTALERDPLVMLPERTDLLNLGLDYTFPWGNGLGITFEYFRYHAGNRFFTGGNGANVLATMVSYPLSLIDNVSAMVFCVPSATRTYWMNYLTWSRTYDDLSVFLMGFINPADYSLPISASQGRNVFSGKGFQFMLSYNF